MAPGNLSHLSNKTIIRVMLDLPSLTVGQLNKLLTVGEITSVQLVEACLTAIETYDGYLHAIISAAPRKTALERARALDDERANGKIRSGLHGIPILVKVPIDRL